MGYQIIKQPDGDLFAIFSSHSDTIIVWDATAVEVVDWFVEQEAARVRERVGVILDQVGQGEAGKAYFQFALSWEEALEQDRQHGGEVHAALEERRIAQRVESLPDASVTLAGHLCGPDCDVKHDTPG